MKKYSFLIFILITFVSFCFKINNVSAADGCYFHVDESSITETTVSYEVKCQEGNYINIVEIKDSGWAFNNQVNYKEKEKVSSYKSTYKVDANRMEATIYLRVQYFNKDGKNVKSTPKEVKFGLTTIPEYKAVAVSETEAAVCITNYSPSFYQNYVLDGKKASSLTFGGIKEKNTDKYYPYCFTKLQPSMSYTLKFCRGNSEDKWSCTNEVVVETPAGESQSDFEVFEDSQEKPTKPENAGIENDAGTRAGGIRVIVTDKNGRVISGNATSCKDVRIIIQDYWKYVMVLSPILLIVLISIDFFKAMASNDIDLIKKSVNNTVKRTIAAVILLALPALLSFILGLFGLELCI